MRLEMTIQVTIFWVVTPQYMAWWSVL